MLIYFRKYRVQFFTIQLKKKENGNENRTLMTFFFVFVNNGGKNENVHFSTNENENGNDLKFNLKTKKNVVKSSLTNLATYSMLQSLNVHSDYFSSKSQQVTIEMILAIQQNEGND